MKQSSALSAAISPRAAAYIVIALVVIGIGAYALLRDRPTDTSTPAVDMKDWRTYRNSQYNFTLKYPSDWEIAQDTENMLAPKISIYKLGQDTTSPPPFDHFINATHVSVYPLGIPTEGVVGETAATRIDFEEQIARAYAYTLAPNGTQWAFYATFTDPPPPWEDWGFVWGRVFVEDMETTCHSGDAIIEESECDPFGNEEVKVVRTGSIDETDRRKVEAILESFAFTG